MENVSKKTLKIVLKFDKKISKIEKMMKIDQNYEWREICCILSKIRFKIVENGYRMQKFDRKIQKELLKNGWKSK